MKEITIKPDHIYTKTEYSKAYNISRPALDRAIFSKEVKVLRIKGATLIVAA